MTAASTKETPSIETTIELLCDVGKGIFPVFLPDEINPDSKQTVLTEYHHFLSLPQTHPLRTRYKTSEIRAGYDRISDLGLDLTTLSYNSLVEELWMMDRT